MSPSAIEQSTAALPDGRRIPRIGLGVFKVPAGETESVVREGLAAGYRHIDTAAVYGNEAGVGAAVRSCGLPRDEIFVTSKLWNDHHGYDESRRGFDTSMATLGLDRLDLYLVHWPMPSVGKAVETWRGLVTLHDEGRVSSVGVSNYRTEDLRRIVEETGVVPAVNQIEVHPYFTQPELRAVHRELGIVTEAWSPLGQGGELLRDPVIAEVARAHDATAAQVVLAWHLALGSVVIPKSVDAGRMRENLAASQISLSGDEVERISSLHRPDGRIGPDPGDFDRVG